jgi:hypothetical protein
MNSYLQKRQVLDPSFDSKNFHTSVAPSRPLPTQRFGTPRPRGVWRAGVMIRGVLGVEGG